MIVLPGNDREKGVKWPGNDREKMVNKKAF